MGSACSAETDFQESVNSNSGVRIEPVDSVAPLPSTVPNNMQRSPPTRTISVLKREDEDERFQRNPQIKKVLGEFDHIRLYLETLQNKNDFDDYEDLHKKLTDKIIDPFSAQSTDEQRLLMGDHLAKIRFHEPLFAVYRKILEDHELLGGISPSLDDEDGDEPYYEAIVVIRTILWNFSDSSKDFALTIADGTELFQWLVNDLQCTFKEGLDNLSSSEFSFNSAVAIVTNCGRSGLNKSSFSVEIREKESDQLKTFQLVDVLMPFLKSKEQFVKLTTLLALSYMVNEDQNQILTADGSLIDFLLNMIKLALDDKDRRYSGFSAHELIDGLAKLAKNDTNKLKIMDKKDTFPMLKKSVLQKKSQEEMLAAVSVVWELAFVERNKKIFAGDKELMAQLEKLQKHPNKDISNTAGRTLFVIDPDNEKNLMKSVDDNKSKLEQPEKEHIMISYQWGNQKTVLNLKDRLRENNFPVWIDVDFMEGSMLQMMASAIEKASVVLICYSEKYKDSKNCRTEAEYAYACNKNTIPILLQHGYRPDGWLGILIGAKKFYDFSGFKYSFDKKFSELKYELEGFLQQQRMTSTNPQPSSNIVKAPGPAPVPHDEIFLLHWKKSDLENWLHKHDLQAFSGLKSLSGEQVGFLYKLSVKAPDFFYKCLEEKLGLKSLEDLMKFDKALEQLSRDHPDINKLLH